MIVISQSIDTSINQSKFVISLAVNCSWISFRRQQTIPAMKRSSKVDLWRTSSSQQLTAVRTCFPCYIAC